MGEEALTKSVNTAWLTAMLTATGTNAPKSFPTSPEDLLRKFKPQKPMNKRQWEAMFNLLFEAYGEKQEGDKAKKPLN